MDWLMASGAKASGREYRQWTSESTAVTIHVVDESARTIEAYKVKPSLVTEHAAIERATRQGGYGHRQIFELVQNGADALLGYEGGRIEVVVAADAVYCANEGEPVTPDGAEAILSSHVSMKRGSEIGRFGVGFKSVLAVSSTPEFFSRSGSFGFDAQWAAEMIREVSPTAKSLPVLRLARTLDPVVAAEGDPVLARLMEWATTIVRLRHSPGAAAWLSSDLRVFPAQFLLFSPHVADLELKDTVSSEHRSIRMSESRGKYRLVDGDTSSDWRLAAAIATLTDDAREDAGFDSDRQSLPVHWAVPLGKRAQRGRFWAFFPTEYVTTLSGIVNAPWKTNEDRQNLLRGPLNERLIDAAAQLVIDTLPSLIDPDDPGRVLDVLPSRDAYGWADQEMNDRIFALARECPSIPDQHGKLVAPTSIHLHPAGLSQETLGTWAAYPDRPRDWAHRSVDTIERRLRAERLVGPGVATVGPWLESLVVDGSAEASRAALQAAVGARRDLPPSQHSSIDHARIILTTTGAMVAPDPESVFLEGTDNTDDVAIVHAQVARDPATHEALDELGITTVDREGLLRAFVASVPREQSLNWETFWSLADGVDPQVVATLALPPAGLARPILALTREGKFHPVGECMLPGEVLPMDGRGDKEVAIDIDFHAGTVPALELLGAIRGPQPDKGSTDSPWLQPYVRDACSAYSDAASEAGDPEVSADRLEMTTHPFPGPLEMLKRLSEEARARFTDACAQLPEPEDWQLSHATQPTSHLVMHYMSPGRWYLRKHGRVRTSKGLLAPERAVGPALEDWSEMLAVARIPSEMAQSLGLASTVESIPLPVWQETMSAALDWDDDAEAGRFYALAAVHVTSPPLLRAETGSSRVMLPCKDVTVVTSRDHVEALTDDGLAVLFVPQDADTSGLCDLWGLRSADDITSVEVNVVRTRDDVPLVDEFPALQFRLSDKFKGLQLARCSEVLVETVTPRGKAIDERDLQIHDGHVFWVDALGDAELVDRLNTELALGLTADEVSKLASRRARRERHELVARIRAQKHDADRVVEALGGTLIRRRLPSQLVEAVEDASGPLSGHDAARLALVVYGAETLKEFREELTERGLQPPQQWNGSRSARAFVRELGFPAAYAGLEQTRRDPWFEVAGPPDLPPLHGFQEAIAKRVQALLPSGVPRRRGLISLPTGAGKTRILVEALVRAVTSGQLNGPILWIAQTDELCEQAVQTWGYVWRGLGPSSSLRISRLWSSNEAELLEGGDQVVVATVAKLGVCVGKEQYDWLSRVSCVVVDEAHGSTTPTYTEIFEWLGFGRSRDRCPLLGLTATPFRGTSVDETNRLVGRYDRKRLDHGLLGEDPYEHLQEMTVLARVRHRLLPGSEISLSDEELDRLRKTRLLPASAGASLTADVNRNRVLIDSVLSLPEDWTVLLYAASVDHAELLAALLSMEGVPSAAVSSRTAPGARRQFVNQFRSGDIRVLTNFAVLTEGFDAPAVRAIYVGRPTFSPNLYQQMIGRGLRGPLNGGKPECLVVNVADNIAQYGEELAFRQFEYLWDEDPDST